ncbi:TNFAIP3-interacting protein 3-like isoform X2 [Gouania willdenowi]|uniref:TNFAIP3-interacting protein 3-like isoform X2 n=1 Tax=Gouania willdenowi TaxID=441366 RepID=UPI00105630C4|nr:TNFAIP3-interacting protein 3-like isoform X2 [Gouania willdenowi]
MDLHGNQTNQSGCNKPIHEDLKPIARLYPSLPNEHGSDTCLAGAERDPGAELHPVTVQEDNKLKNSSCCAGFSLKAQVVFLKEQRKQLLSINEKWAKEYRTMVHYYKKKISQTLKPDQFMESKAKISTDETNLKTEGEDCDADLLKIQTEAKQLRLQNRTLTHRGQHQREEIDRLNKALAAALQTAQPVMMSSEIHPDIWKHQAEVYKEDFLRERKDRENLKQKYFELERRFSKTCKELHIFKSQMNNTQQPVAGDQCLCRDGDTHS